MEIGKFVDIAKELKALDVKAETGVLEVKGVTSKGSALFFAVQGRRHTALAQSSISTPHGEFFRDCFREALDELAGELAKRVVAAGYRNLAQHADTTQDSAVEILQFTKAIRNAVNDE